MASSDGDQAKGERSSALDLFLEARLAEGFRVESRTPTQAIIASPVSALGRLRKLKVVDRQVVEVDEHNQITMTPAQPLRS